MTYIAPAGDRTYDPRLRRIIVPRAQGRSRLRALRAVKRALQDASRHADVTMVHDPELLLTARAISGPRIWDVHEDVIAQVGEKSYVPALLTPLVRAGFRVLIRMSSKSFDLLIAEQRMPSATLRRLWCATPSGWLGSTSTASRSGRLSRPGVR